MTQPQPHGYVDWGRFSAHTTRVHFSDTVTVASAGLTILNVFIGDIPFIGTSFVRNAAGSGVRASVFFYADQTFTNQTGSFKIALPTIVDRFKWALPTRGPFLRVSLEADTTDTDVTVQIYDVDAPGEIDHDPIFINELLTDDNVLVPSSGSNLAFANTIWPGPAHLSIVADTPTPWLAELLRQDFQGNENVISAFRSDCELSLFTHVELPYAPAGIRITDESGTTRTFRRYLIGRPNLGT